jgi:glutathione S-transferase
LFSLHHVFDQPRPTPLPPLPPSSGSDVFPAFVAFLKADPGSPDEATKRDTLHTALRALDAHLASAGPWLGGATLGQADCALAPKLHHMVVALGAFKGWALPADAARVGAYLDAWRARPSWTAHEYSDEAVVAGWKKHMEKK